MVVTPAGGSRAGRRLEAFPVGPPRLVDMDVGIDDARRDDKRPAVDDVSARGDVVDVTDRDDRAAVDLNRRRTLAVRKDDARAAKDFHD